MVAPLVAAAAKGVAKSTVMDSLIKALGSKQTEKSGKAMSGMFKEQQTAFDTGAMDKATNMFQKLGVSDMAMTPINLMMDRLKAGLMDESANLMKEVFELMENPFVVAGFEAMLALLESMVDTASVLVGLVNDLSTPTGSAVQDFPEYGGSHDPSIGWTDYGTETTTTTDDLYGDMPSKYY